MLSTVFNWFNNWSRTQTPYKGQEDEKNFRVFSGEKDLTIPLLSCGDVLLQLN